MAFQYSTGGYQGNPQGATNFNIRPGNDYSAGLTGMTKALGVMGAQMKEKKAKEQAQTQYTDIRTRIEAASSLPDYERAQEIAKLQGQYPEVMTKFGDSLVGYDTTARNLGPRKQIVGRTLQAVAQDPDNAMAYYQKAKAELTAQGVTQTPVLDSAMQEIQSNPQAAGRNALTNLQLLAPDRAAAFKASQPDQKELMGKVNPNDWTPSSLKEYARTGDYGSLVAAVKPPSEMSELTRAIASQTLSDRQEAASTRRQASAKTAKAEGAEATRRASVPERVDNAYPNASAAERDELQAAAEAAPTAQEGIKAASEVRTTQRNNTRGQALVDKTKLLVAQVLNSPDWQDAVGPMEGKGAWYNVHGGGEADVVADIKEAKGLLTLPNMSLMSGVLSQSDMEFLQSISGGALERTRTDDRFRKDAMDLLKGLGTPTLNQQGEVDSLPSGTVFIYSDGLPYIKD